MAANPRIDDLRKRLEKDPGSRLFAQLAEELRKDGELEEAIQVARAGLKAHPSYPSARMTLGRALLDTGDWAAARSEFENVLTGAPDNILASRYLAECLENLGDREGALGRYKSTLAMAPGERHVMAKIEELEKGGTRAAPAPPLAPALRAPATGAFARPTGVFPRPATGAFQRPVQAPPSSTAPTPPAPPAGLRPPTAKAPAPPTPPVPPPPAPRAPAAGPVAAAPAPVPAPAPPVEPPAAPREFAPIPLVDADEEFELERPYESPVTTVGLDAKGEAPPPAVAPRPVERPAQPPIPPPAAAVAPEPIPLSPVDDQEFELEAPNEAAATAWKPAIPPLPVAEPDPVPAAAPPPMAAPVFEPPAAPDIPPPVAPPAPARPAPPEAAGQDALLSPTLGELYFNQGFTDKAIEVYRELASREPGNERVSARLRELQALQRSLEEPARAEAPAVAAPLPAPVPAAVPAPEEAPDPARERRQAIERTIGRLEGLLAAIRKG